jgi:hypothetical protein
LTGFLFGNLGADGQLDEDDASFLDKDTREKLGGLQALLRDDQEDQQDELQGILHEETKVKLVYGPCVSIQGLD